MSMSEPSLSMNDQRSDAMDKSRRRFTRWREPARRMLPFISGMFAALLAIFLYNFLFPGARPLTQNEVSTAVFNAIASATPRPAYSTLVYQVIQPSLVLIETDSPSATGEDHGLGSGVIINDVGDILTSLHVVANSSNIRITFADGTQSNATVAATQPEKDIAVLQAELLPELFVPATLGNPAALQVGDEAFVVGNPFGLYSSMSSGVISGFNRSFQPPGTSQVIEGLIQIDAAVNPGNSGGPLLNRAGHVVGIITGIINPTEESFFIGIGFAVPINVAAGGAGLPPY